MKKKRKNLPNRFNRITVKKMKNNMLAAIADSKHTLDLGKQLNNELPELKNLFGKILPGSTDSFANFLSGTLLKSLGVTEITVTKDDGENNLHEEKNSIFVLTKRA